MNAQEWDICEDFLAMLRVVTGTATSRQAALLSGRKTRLLACACAWSRWGEMDDISRSALSLAEQFADGVVDRTAISTIVFGVHLTQWDYRDLMAACTDLPVSPSDLEVLYEERVLPGNVCDIMRDIIGNPLRPIDTGWYHTVTHPDGTYTQNVPSLGSTWITPTVLSVVQAAYEERPGRECDGCDGRGQRGRCRYCRGTFNRPPGSLCYSCAHPRPSILEPVACDQGCHGTGRVEDGTLDPFRVMLVAEALEDAGCEEQCLLSHLRSQVHHYRGCWALDLVRRMS